MFNFVSNGLENFLMALRSEILDESPRKRTDIIPVVRYFENKKKQIKPFLLLISLQLIYYFCH